MGKDKTDTLAEQLRQAIRADGRTLYRLSKDSGVCQATLRRFMAGQRGITLPTADRICRGLGVAFGLWHRRTK